MHKNLSNFVEMSRAGVDAGNDEVEAIDTQGYDGVLVVFRAAEAALEVSAVIQADTKTSDRVHTTDRVNVEGSKIEAGDISQHDLIWYDIYRPTKRYIGFDLNSNANVSDDDVFVFKYHSGSLPADNDGDNIIGKLLVSKEEGTP